MFTTEDTEGTEEYIFTMKDLKNMKIIHESTNERANGRVHSLTPALPLSSLWTLWWKKIFVCFVDDNARNGFKLLFNGYTKCRSRLSKMAVLDG